MRGKGVAVFAYHTVGIAVSAVIITAPPISVAAFTTLPTHSSTDSTVLTAALALRADTLRLHSALFVVLSHTNIAKREKAIFPFKAVKRRVIILSSESSIPVISRRRIKRCVSKELSPM